MPSPEDMNTRGLINQAATSRCLHEQPELEKATSLLGMFGMSIQNYHTQVGLVCGGFSADLIERAQTQAAYDVITNMPTGIVDTLDRDRATETVINSIVVITGKLIEWDIHHARKLAAKLLEEVNDHELAAYVYSK